MLRNAFDLLATEGTLRNLLRAVTFAKTSSDQLRVNVDNAITVTAANVYNSLTNASMMGANNQQPHWGAASWNAMDARYPYGEALVGNYIQNRQRWTVS